MLTGKFRASFVSVFTPKVPMGGTGDPKYSITMLIPKSDAKTLNEIFAEIERVKQAGAAEVWGNRIPPNCRIPIYDGDGVKPSDGEPFGKECEGHFVLRASSNQKPSVVDANVNPIINPAEFYSGCYARATVNFFAYDRNGNKGIGCGLNNVQKIEDGEPFTSRTSAAEDFGGGNAYGAGTPAYVPMPAYGAPQAPAYGMQPAPGNPPVGYGAQGNPYQAPAPPTYGAPGTPVAYGGQQTPTYPPQGVYQQPAIDPVTGYPMNGGVMGIS